MVDVETINCSGAQIKANSLCGTQTFVLCWEGNPDALIYHKRLFFSRIFGIVSLKLFYNYGRLPLITTYGLGGGKNGRIISQELDYDRSHIKTEQGYHCKLCGRPLKEINSKLRKFCPEHEIEFYRRFVQFRSWNEYREKVFLKDNGKCVMCGKILGHFLPERNCWVIDETFYCDHIVPLFKGGKDWHEDPEMTNFQTLCVDCNKIKTRCDVAKPHVVQQKLGLKTIQYARFVFEKLEQKTTTLEDFIS